MTRRIQNTIKPDLARLTDAREIAAILAGISDAYIPIFSRLDDEVKRASAAMSIEPVNNARQMIDNARHNND